MQSSNRPNMGISLSNLPRLVKVFQFLHLTFENSPISTILAIHQPIRTQNKNHDLQSVNHQHSVVSEISPPVSRSHLVKIQLINPASTRATSPGVHSSAHLHFDDDCLFRARQPKKNRFPHCTEGKSPPWSFLRPIVHRRHCLPPPRRSKNGLPPAEQRMTIKNPIGYEYNYPFVDCHLVSLVGRPIDRQSPNLANGKVLVVGDDSQIAHTSELSRWSSITRRVSKKWVT